jgi:hypothetical protein
MAAESTPQPDDREQLFNDRRCGPITQVSLPREAVTTLHAVMIDIDPKQFRADNPLVPATADPYSFFHAILPVLNRHPVAQHAEVRMSGSGLHLLHWLDPPIELKSAAEQEYWAAVIDAHRSTLPSDPAAPNLNALTRPIGSVNSKTGRKVEQLREGRPLAATVFEDFIRAVDAKPFREIARLLIGGDHVSPCPACRKDGSRMTISDHIGHCYSCGKITVAVLFDSILLDE